ncbi:MAG: hypothetical protein VXZ72_04760, partial [Chlamydiota bacterium]|nr:hypothetical protein [Chlamydiota bacterium]
MMLSYPYSWQERRPLSHEKTLYIPDHYLSHRGYPLPCWESFLSGPGDLMAECCSGNGEWILKQALQNPHQRWVAIEWDFPRLCQIARKREGQGVPNLYLISGDATTWILHYL